MEMTGHPDAGVAGQPSDAESQLLRGLVDYLRQKRPELQQEWATRITDAQLLRVMRADEIYSEVTAVYDKLRQRSRDRKRGGHCAGLCPRPV